MSIGRRPLSKKSEPLTVEIFLDHYVPDITQRISLTSAFIKFLCYQKGQIPVPYIQLENRLKAVQSELGDPTCENHHENSSVPRMKERMALQKTKRKKTQFSKNASNFISTLTEMDEIVSCSFHSGSNNQVALILGTSVFNPLETYILDWSEYPSNNMMINATESTDIARNLKQNQATLFRHLVTAEQLFPVLHPIKQTKLHIMTNLRGSVVTPIGCLPRLNFKFPKTRGHQVILKFRRNELISRNMPQSKEPTESEHSETSRVCRRLMFYSPVPNNSKRLLKDDSSLEISGILQIDDETAEKCNLSSTLEAEEDLCWFQLQNSLQGFQDIF